MRRLKSRKQIWKYENPPSSQHSPSAFGFPVYLLAVQPGGSHSDKHPEPCGYIYTHLDPNSTPANPNTQRYSANLPDPARARGNRRNRSNQASTGVHDLPATLL